MTWFKVDDNLHSHNKARQAGLPALGLWVVAGSYCGQYLTEGVVPEWFVTSWPSGKKLAAELVKAGLWSKVDDGWLFHQWGERQPAKEQVVAERKATRDRQQKWRDRKRDARVTETVSDGERNGVTAGVSNGVGNAAPTRPEPTKVKNAASQPERKTTAPTPETVNQRANRLARIYTDKRKLSNFPAVAGVVRKAIAAEHDDTAITSALTRLADDNRSVTADSLRYELEGIPASQFAKAARPEPARHSLWNDAEAAS